jgi:hypothetical protein
MTRRKSLRETAGDEDGGGSDSESSFRVVAASSKLLEQAQYMTAQRQGGWAWSNLKPATFKLPLSCSAVQCSGVIGRRTPARCGTGKQLEGALMDATMGFQD